MSTLYVDRRATEAKLDAGAIVFSAEGVRLATVPIAPVTRLIINGGLTLDSSLLGKLGEQNIGVIILTGYKHEPVLFRALTTMRPSVCDKPWWSTTNRPHWFVLVNWSS